MIEIRISPDRGRGVFATEMLEAGIIVEEAPVIVMPEKDRPLLDQTLLHDYIFEWGDDHRQSAIALGYVSIYNHAAPSNCEYEMDFEHATIRIRTVKKVDAGEELFINYNGQATDLKPVWFPSV